MARDTIDLDSRRGMAAQKETELRRRVKEVAEDRARLKARQDALEHSLISAPAANWGEAAEKMRYLLSLFAETAAGQDPRRQKLVANLLGDIERLLAAEGDSVKPAGGE